MDIVSIILTLLSIALVGFLVHLIVNNIPMPDMFKQTLIVVTVVLLVIYILLVLTGKAPLVHFPALSK